MKKAFIKILESSSVVITNILIFLILIIITEIFFGYWFKNNLNIKLASERNIHRVYNLDFKYLKNDSSYIKNNDGFRINKINDSINNADIAFIGGSTVNQKFLNYNESMVGIISDNKPKIKIVNAGVDGMSIKGHIKSHGLWFDKIKNFNPKYYIYIIGINDRYLVDTFSFRDHIDNLEESDSISNLRELLESNSFFFTKGRYIKSLMYLKYGLKIGSKDVKKNHVYLERNKNEFISFFERERKYNQLSDKKKYIKFENWYSNRLEELSNIVTSKGSVPIYINQTTGYGHSFESYIVAKTITKHCKEKKITCLNSAKNLQFKFEDFYDESHLNIEGSKKFADYILKNLDIFQ